MGCPAALIRGLERRSPRNARHAQRPAHRAAAPPAAAARRPFPGAAAGAMAQQGDGEAAAPDDRHNAAILEQLMPRGWRAPREPPPPPIGQVQGLICPAPSMVSRRP